MTTWASDATEPCWLCVTRTGIIPALKTTWHRFETCSSSLRGSNFGASLDALAYALSWVKRCCSSDNAGIYDVRLTRMLSAPYVEGDFAGALFSAVIKVSMNVLSPASLSLTLGCKEAYAKPSIELC